MKPNDYLVRLKGQKAQCEWAIAALESELADLLARLDLLDELIHEENFGEFPEPVSADEAPVALKPTP